MNRSILISFIILNFLFLPTSLSAQQADTTREKAAIGQLVKNYEDAWNRHDAKGLADNYDANATWVNWFGAYYKGRDDIQFHYRQVHTTYFKNTHYLLK